MSQYQIKTEGELFSNNFINPSGLLDCNSRSMDKISSPEALVQQQVFTIFKKHRKIFLNSLSSTWKLDMEKKKDNIFSYQLPLEDYGIMVRAIRYARQCNSLAEG